MKTAKVTAGYHNKLHYYINPDSGIAVLFGLDEQSIIYVHIYISSKLSHLGGACRECLKHATSYVTYILFVYTTPAIFKTFLVNNDTQMFVIFILYYFKLHTYRIYLNVGGIAILAP